MPALSPVDVASALTFAISVKEGVEVSNINLNDFLLINLLFQVHEIVIKPVGEYL